MSASGEPRAVLERQDEIHSASPLSSTKHPSTPSRSVRSRHKSNLEDTPTAKPSPFDALRFNLKLQGVGEGPLHDSKQTSRKGYGIPTPPYSEAATSSTGGSTGRARKDSDDPSGILPCNRSLQPHSGAYQVRSPSAASSSSRTGSETIGARSPLEKQDHFRSYSAINDMESPIHPESSEARRSVLGRSRLADVDSGASSPSLSSRKLSGDPPGSERKRRSELHERDVSQIRSESRIGSRYDDVDGDEDRSQTGLQSRDTVATTNTNTISTNHKYSPRKSTTLSRASNYHEQHAEDDHHSPSSRLRSNLKSESFDSELRSQTSQTSPAFPTSHNTPNDSRYSDIDRSSSTSMRRLSRTTGHSTGRLSLDSVAAGKSAQHRNPMPAEFRLPDKEIRKAYRAAHARQASGEQYDSEESDNVNEGLNTSNDRNVTRSGGRKSSLTHQEELDKILEEANHSPDSSAQSQLPRRRYVSDAAAEGQPVQASEYDGRLSTNGHRISVDSSSVQRYLNRGSQHSTPSTGTRRLSRPPEAGSPSEEARIRKISTSSNRSQKSSNSASELHRAASRVSMRKSHGRDPFASEEEYGPLAQGARSHSPTGRTERSSLTGGSDKTRSLADTSRHHNNRALDELRSQIEDLRVTSASTQSQQSHRPNHQLGSIRSSVDLKSPTIGSLRAHSVMGVNRTPGDVHRLPRLPITDPQRSRFDRSPIIPDPDHSSDAVHRIHDLANLRGGGRALPQRSSTAMGIVSDTFEPSPRPSVENGDEPAPIRNMTIRLSQFENLYSKVPAADPSVASAAGPETARVVKLMGAIATGTSTLWSEMAAMHPIATEGHLMNLGGDDATAAFGQLDEGFAFLNKLVLEQARAVQDLLFSLERMEKERQAQFNQVLQELGHSPRPFSRVGAGSVLGGGGSGSSERGSAHLRRAISSVRGDASASSTGSPFPRGAVERSGTLTASQIRSMTSLGHTGSHGRSASELSPSSSAALRRHERGGGRHPLPFSADTAKLDTSPTSQPRSARERSFPAGIGGPGSMAGSSTSSASGSRPPPSFTPREPRLSNPSVSNATASFQPAAASSTVSASPETRRSSTEDSAYGTATDEFGRVTAADGSTDRRIAASTLDTVKFPTRRLRERGAVNGFSSGSGHRVVDTLHSQLDGLGVTAPMELGARRHTLQTRSPASGGIYKHDHPSNSSIGISDVVQSPTESSNEELGGGPARNTSSSRLSQYGLTKSTNPPPRPPRHIKRPSEESVSKQYASPSVSASRRGSVANASSQFQEQPQEEEEEVVKDPTANHAHVGGPGSSSILNSTVVRSLGRTAARRMSRVFGGQQPPQQSLSQSQAQYYDDREPRQQHQQSATDLGVD